MITLQNFVFEDHLVRVVDIDGQPWFVAKDVCAVLGIIKYRDAIASLDDDEGRPVLVDTLGGKQELAAVSEPGVYRLVFRSRKPEAERFKRWLAHEVLPAIRRTGRYAPAEPIIDDQGEGPVAAMRLRLDMVKTARVLWGPARAAVLWDQLGLPPAPPAPKVGLEDARACLATILDWRPNGFETMRELIEKALADDGAAGLELRPFGIRPIVEGPEDGFVVANRNSGELARLFKGTPWDGMRWMRTLRRLPGAQPTGPFSWGAGMPSTRGTFLPGRFLDQEAMAA